MTHYVFSTMCLFFVVFFLFVYFCNISNNIPIISDICLCRLTCVRPGLEVIKLFSCSAQLKIFPVQKC